MIPWLRAALATLAGAALSVSFAPNEWWWLAFPAVALFYGLLRPDLTTRQATLLGWLFGVGYFGLGVNWVYHSLHLFGAAVAPLAAFLTALFVLVMTLFTAAIAGCLHRWRRGRAVGDAVLFAALWTLFELLRGKLFGGFPWILLGYSQTGAALGELAPVIGVYGIGFLVALSAAMLVEILFASMRARIVALAIVLAVVAGALLAGRIAWSEPLPRSLRVRMVQANIPQEMKFSRERLQNSLYRYTDMTLQPGIENVDLVIWPETAIPTYFDRVDEALLPFVARVDAAGAEVLAGGFQRDGDAVYNSVRQLGGERALYRKRHLVPFGEFMPMRFLLDAVARFIEIPMSDLSAGEGPHRPLVVGDERIGLSICYEDVYGEEMRALLPESTLLVNVSNDAWFGNSAAPHQHEQKARMRAREFARPMVRVTNTGVSSAIDHRGRVISRIRHDVQSISDVDIVPRTGTTPYARLGNWPVGIVAWLILLPAVLRRWRTSRHLATSG